MATTTKPMAKTTKATDKKRAPRSTSRKSAENGDQKKHYRPAPSLPMQNEGMLNMAIKAARDAGKIQVIAFRDRSNLQISNKSLGDYVTEVDKECERVIVETLKTAYPDHAFLGEETGESGKKDAEYTWVIDPLDGTTNFIHGIPQFAVSIALLKTVSRSMLSSITPWPMSSLPQPKAKVLTLIPAVSASPAAIPCRMPCLPPASPSAKAITTMLTSSP